MVEARIFLGGAQNITFYIYAIQICCNFSFEVYYVGKFKALFKYIIIG